MNNGLFIIAMLISFFGLFVSLAAFVFTGSLFHIIGILLFGFGAGHFYRKVIDD